MPVVGAVFSRELLAAVLSFPCNPRGGDYEPWHVFGPVRTTREKMRRTILETRMHPVLSCWCVVATVTLALAAWQENIRPKMYVQLGK